MGWLFPVGLQLEAEVKLGKPAAADQVLTLWDLDWAVEGMV